MGSNSLSRAAARMQILLEQKVVFNFLCLYPVFVRKRQSAGGLNKEDTKQNCYEPKSLFPCPKLSDIPHHLTTPHTLILNIQVVRMPLR